MLADSTPNLITSTIPRPNSASLRRSNTAGGAVVTNKPPHSGSSHHQRSIVNGSSMSNSTSHTRLSINSDASSNDTNIITNNTSAALTLPPVAQSPSSPGTPPRKSSFLAESSDDQNANRAESVVSITNLTFKHKTMSNLFKQNSSPLLLNNNNSPGNTVSSNASTTIHRPESVSSTLGRVRVKEDESSQANDTVTSSILK